MAFSAARRLSAGAGAATSPPILSSLFIPRRVPKPRPQPPEHGDEPRQPKPKSKPRRPWGEDAAALLRRLHEGGHLPWPDIPIAPQVLSPDVVKAAAERFGQEHQVAANAYHCRWLSGSDLKRVALFGCPSVERRTVFASKRLRSFFSIKEDKICISCKLKTSCKFQNQGVPRHDKVILSDTMRILTSFVLDACPQQLQVTAELKATVCKLLKDTINLSN